MPQSPPVPRIAARYTGAFPVLLAPRPGDLYLDANGAPLQPQKLHFNGGATALYLCAGDSLMVPETEVLGATYLIDPIGDRPQIYLGAGLVLLPADQDKDWKSLVGVRFTYNGPPVNGVEVPGGVWQYDFSLGRQDFEPVTPDPRQFPDVPPITPAVAPAPVAAPPPPVAQLVPVTPILTIVPNEPAATPAEKE